MVPQSNQVNPIHYLAQLQMDNSENYRLVDADCLPCPILLFITRLHNQEDVGGIDKQKVLSSLTDQLCAF